MLFKFRLIKVSFKAILRNGMRSFLTMLGVIIGVAAVIALSALGEGSEESIREDISSLGTNVLMVMPYSASEGGVRMGMGSAQTLTIEDVEAVERFNRTIRYISPLVRTQAQVAAGSQNWNTSIYGTYADYFRIRDMNVAIGRLFDQQEAQSMQKICVIGTVVAENLFGTSVEALGKTIRINNVPFRVIGILEEKGQAAMGQDQDDLIVAPFKTIQRRLIGTSYLNQIVVSAVSEEQMEQAETEIQNILIEYQNKVDAFGEPKFSVRTQTDIINVFSSVTGMMALLLTGIASISLLVGGIGIMNIMLVSVTERTREIGLRLAVGATEKTVMIQFLMEAILLSLMGGFIGIVCGYGIAFVANNFIDWPAIITFESVVLAFGFAFAVGVFFGFYPARKASLLNPIDALRYE